ncbi:hypothetical protein [Streptomyces sp. NPDC051180]|uniref:hypothetical protein n=1 Tax=unclassified Streptomyces TaxID=2593676 RepID=UPI003450D820
MTEAPARTPGTAAVPVVRPTDLPGVRTRLRDVTSDLAAGLNCLWLVTDAMVESGLADTLYREALAAAPVHVDVPAPARGTEPRSEPEPPPAASGAGADDDGAGGDGRTGTGGRPEGDELPYLDLPDDGFDLDLGWTLDGGPPRLPAPRRDPGTTRRDPHGLTARLGDRLGVTPDQAVPALVARARGQRPVVGVRAWREHDGGQGAAALFRSLAAAVKEAGLPPGERPRLLVVARLGDLPEPLPDALRDGHGDTAVHWWWGVLGRLDTATAILSAPDHGHGPGRARDPLADRVRRAVRSETVVEICGPDLELARLLVLEWDGAQHTLADALGRCLAATGAPPPGECPPLRRIGALARPGTELRRAWSRGAVVSWEGRLRHHVAVWHPAAPADGTAPAPTADARARLAALVSQAQQRVLTPWIEEARQRLAARALGHLTRPVAAVVAEHAERPAAELRGDPERAFGELQVGELLGAHISGSLALPPDDARLLRLLVMARNVLSHRSVLYDRTLDDLCAELSRADLRAS